MSATDAAQQPVRFPSAGRSSRLRPTLREVARLSGMSPSTVSAVLNNRKYCWAAESSRRKIMEAANALGYRPNVAARALRGGPTHTVGLITAALNIEVTALKVEGFEEAARA